MRASALALLLPFAACQSAPTVATEPPPIWDSYIDENERLGAPLAGARLSAEGLGPLRIGMHIGEVNALLNAAIEAQARNGSCSEWTVVQTPAGGIGLLAHNERVSRISVSSALGIRTREGLGIGSTAAEVRAAHPDAQRVAAEYFEEPAHDLYVWRDTDIWIGLHFEIDEQGRVVEMQGGGELRNIEGCAGL